MVSFRFTPPEPVPEAGGSGFGLGRLEVSGDQGDADSSGPARAMMVLPSAVLLLDGVRKMLAARRPKPYEFVGTGSSFALRFTPESRAIAVTSGGRRIGTVERAELARELLRAATDLAEAAERRVPPGEAARSDLEAAIRAFRAFLDESGL